MTPVQELKMQRGGGDADSKDGDEHSDARYAQAPPRQGKRGFVSVATNERKFALNIQRGIPVRVGGSFLGGRGATFTRVGVA